jgi:hypothetical protein
MSVHQKALNHGGSYINEIDAALARDAFIKDNSLEGYTFNFK